MGKRNLQAGLTSCQAEAMLLWMYWMRVGLIGLGSFLVFMGAGKTIWEIYSWGKLSELGERVPLVGNNPRVHFRIFIVIAALGATLIAAGVLL